jgi:hypothetical protein
MNPERIRTQMQLIGRAMWPKLSAKERETLEIRPSLTLGDVFIELNGRFWPVESDLFAKVIGENGVETHVDHILTRLRGHKYIFKGENDPITRGEYQFSYEMVLKEVNNALVTLCSAAFTEDDEKRVSDRIQKSIFKAVGVRRQPRKESDYTTAELKVINKILIDELGKILEAKKANG